MKFHFLLASLSLLFFNSNHTYAEIYLQNYETPQIVKYGVNTVVLIEPKKDACSQKMCAVVTPKWNSSEPKKLQLRSHIAQLHVNIRSASILIDGQEIILNTENSTTRSENLDGSNKLSMQNHYANYDIIDRILSAQEAIIKIRTTNGETETLIKSQGQMSQQGEVLEVLEVLEVFKSKVNSEKLKLGIE